MTTSGETDYDATRENILYGALRLIGAYATGGKPKAHQVTDANKALNLMIKTWQIQGFLWVKEFVTLFTVKGQTSYDLPGAHGAVNGKYLEVATDADHVLTDTILTLTDTTGMSPDDNIGVFLDDGTVSWGVILTVDSSTQVTLVSGLSGNSVAGLTVYTYAPENALYRPTRIFNAQRKASDGHEVDIQSLSRDDYAKLTSKGNEGTIVEYYFDPQLSVAKLYVWNTASNNNEKLLLDVDRPLQIMIDSADTYDFPQEWLEPIKYGLALRLCPEYAVPSGERAQLKEDYAFMISNLISYNMDYTSTFLGVEFNG